MRIFCPVIPSMGFVSIDRLNGSPTVISNRRSSNVLSYGRSPAAASTFVFAPGFNFGRWVAAWRVIDASAVLPLGEAAAGPADAVVRADSDVHPDTNDVVMTQAIT